MPGLRRATPQDFTSLLWATALIVAGLMLTVGLVMRGRQGACVDVAVATDLREPVVVVPTQKGHEQISDCYLREVLREAIWGYIVVRVLVDATGLVVDAEIVNSTVQTPTLEACVLSQLKTWRFPQRADGKRTFEHRFSFGKELIQP